MPVGPELLCRAYIKCHTEPMSVLIRELTCIETSASGPKSLVLIQWVRLTSKASFSGNPFSETVGLSPTEVQKVLLLDGDFYHWRRGTLGQTRVSR